MSTPEFILQKEIDQHKSTGFISTYKPIAGWKAVQYWWNPKMEGFWEPYDTSSVAFATEKEAYLKSIQWAIQMKIPYIYRPDLETQPRET